MSAREDALALLDAVLGGLPAADQRAGQREMVARIAESLEADEHLLVQAGTGTGKSLAYLTAAVFRRRRVLVTTASKALQAQLLDKDLPRVAAALKQQTKRTLTSAVAKGRGNYLCLERLDSGEDQLGLEDGSPSSRREKQVVQLRRWADETETGDRDDVDFAVDDLAWRAVSVDGRDCLGQRCPHREDCFSERARALAAEADVVVANHAMLAADLGSERGVLPPRSVVILDEAHDFERFVTDAMTAELSSTGTARTLRLARPLLPAARAELLGQALTDVDAALRDLPAGLLTELPDELRVVVGSLMRAAAGAATELEKPGEDAAESRDHLAKQALLDLADTAERLLNVSASQAIYAIRGADATAARLRVSPLVVAATLRDRLLQTTPVVATSATLFVEGNADYVARALGFAPPDEGEKPPPAEDEDRRGQDRPDAAGSAPGDPGGDDRRHPRVWRSVDVGSPFDYGRQAQLYLARDLPHPGREAAAWSQAVDEELVELITAAGGRTLGLFSSTAAARRAAEHVRGRLADYPILLQGEDTPERLAWRFASDPRTCLFATRGFWQGFDSPGSTCQLVVIDRIPFPSPDEPLSKARSARATENGLNAFATVSVPAAAIPLAQGVGRLIRAAGDRGVVAVLDPRLATERYAARLRRSLPPMYVTSDRAQVLRSLAAIDASAPPVLDVGPEPALARRARRA